MAITNPVGVTVDGNTITGYGEHGARIDAADRFTITQNVRHHRPLAT